MSGGVEAGLSLLCPPLMPSLQANHMANQKALSLRGIEEGDRKRQIPLRLPFLTPGLPSTSLTYRAYLAYILTHSCT